MDKIVVVLIMVVYGLLVYFLLVIGGFVSDCILGSCKIVLYGGILIMLGYIVLVMLFG